MTLAEEAAELEFLAEPDVAAADRPARAGTASFGLRRVLLGLDAAAIGVAWLVASAVSPPFDHGLSATAMFARVATAVLFSVLLLHWQRLYQARVCSTRVVEMVGILRAAAGGALLVLLLPGPFGQRTALAHAAFGAGLSIACLACTRGFYDAWLRAERAAGRFTRQVVVVGQSTEAERVLELLRHHPELGYRVCGLVGDHHTAFRHGIPWLGEALEALPAVLATGATGAVLATAGMPPDDIEVLMRDLLTHGLHLQVSAGLWQVDARRLQAAPLAHEPFFYLERPALAVRQLRLKRALDLVIAGMLLVLFAPALVLTALAIKLGDRGPVLFRQVRIGRDGKPFTLLKFRTMAIDAEARLADLRALNERNGPLFKLAQDPRVTKVGRVLRATSLDELPQLFNVLAGSMSLVGPRPALPSEVASFDADLLSRHRVTPGITGLWQLEARENASFYAYRHLDLFYVENWSCALDLVILAATVPALAARSIRSVLGRADIAGELA